MPYSSLGETVAQAIPKDVKLLIRHLSTSPASCPAIFSAPSGENPEPTACKSHFFAISTESGAGVGNHADNRHELLIFAIEVLIYTTAQLTTIFVSKADSTGYLYLLNLSPTATSLIRNASTSFLSHLVSTHQRPGIRLVVSLFARAQSQYLFPGSVENSHKHILDDRGLVKWWCRVFDPILRSFEVELHDRENERERGDAGEEGKGHIEMRKDSAAAYLIVPGCDRFETRTFFPATAKADRQDQPRWINSYPFRQICSSPTAPPRCLIPRFPDDPKARFLVELDDEIPGIAESSSPLKGKFSEEWRSVKSLEQFWEMMAFRQECSAGRLVGFLWMVINQHGRIKSDLMTNELSQNTSSQALAASLPTPQPSQIPDAAAKPRFSDRSSAEDSGTEIKPEERNRYEHQPMDKNGPVSSIPLRANPSLEETPGNGYGEEENPNRAVGRMEDGTILISNKDYQSLVDFLLQLDFSDERTCIESTDSWIQKISAITGCQDHGEIVIGKAQSAIAVASLSTTASNLLGSGLIRKRKREAGPDAFAGKEVTDGITSMASRSEVEQGESQSSNTEELAPAVNMLDGHLIRKKKKTR
jgi:regulator of Ty1 transposition protein 109